MKQNISSFLWICRHRLTFIILFYFITIGLPGIPGQPGARGIIPLFFYFNSILLNIIVLWLKCLLGRSGMMYVYIYIYIYIYTLSYHSIPNVVSLGEPGEPGRVISAGEETQMWPWTTKSVIRDKFLKLRTIDPIKSELISFPWMYGLLW